MNIKAYIESGILELFALDLLAPSERKEVIRLLELYPCLKEEFAKIENAIEEYARKNAVNPPAHVQKNLEDAILNLQKEALMDLSDLPLLHKYADYKKWLQLAEQFTPMPAARNGRSVHVLRHDQQVTQLLIVSATGFEEEVHDEVRESFLILSGACRCSVGGRVTLMSAGDFMEIPLFEPHHVELISPTVTAILQHQYC